MTGEELKELGIAQVSACAEDECWKGPGLLLMSHFTVTWRVFDPNDWREEMGDTLTPHHHNAISALFSKGTRMGILQRIGTHNARRPEQHAVKMSVYRGYGTIEPAWNTADVEWFEGMNPYARPL